MWDACKQVLRGCVVVQVHAVLLGHKSTSLTEVSLAAWLHTARS